MKVRGKKKQKQQKQSNTLDDKFEQWVEGKSRDELDAEFEKKRASENRYFERYDNGIYLYRTTLADVRDYYTSSTLIMNPDTPRGSSNIGPSQVLGFATEIGPQAVDISQELAKQHHVVRQVIRVTGGSRTEGSTEIMSRLGEAHDLHAVSGRAGQVYFANGEARLIRYPDLRSAGEHGDYIAEKHAKGLSVSTTTANMWIVTTQNPASIKKERHIDQQFAFFFFKKEDAKKFIKNANSFFATDALTRDIASANLKIFSNEEDIHGKKNIHDEEFVFKVRGSLRKLNSDIEVLRDQLNTEIERLDDLKLKHPSARLTKKLQYARDQRDYLNLILYQSASLSRILKSIVRMNIPYVVEDLNQRLLLLQENAKHYTMAYVANNPAERHESKFVKAVSEAFSELRQPLIKQKGLKSAVVIEEYQGVQENKSEADRKKTKKNKVTSARSSFDMWSEQNTNKNKPKKEEEGIVQTHHLGKKARK